MGLDIAGVAMDTRGYIKVDDKLRTGAPGIWAIHGILDIMYAKAPYMVLQRSVGIHPTASELIPTVLGDLGASQG